MYRTAGRTKTFDDGERFGIHVVFGYGAIDAMEVRTDEEFDQGKR